MHIEPTTRCTLLCPGCSRTWFSEKFKRSFPKHDLNLDDFQRFLDCDSGRAVTSFLLCGNHGDPIYYPKLLDLISKLRPASVKISTNGSYASEKFWLDLRDVVAPGDTVYFSIDGTEETNHLYRRNADWNTIMKGLQIMVKSPAKIVWKSLIFKFNQDQIQEIKETAESHGAVFHVETTGYFGDESLCPDQSDLIRHDLTYEKSKTSSDLDPKCVNNGTGYVSADGYYWPCCMISNVQSLYQTELWRNRHSWLIKNQNLDTMLRQVNDWADKIRYQGNQAPAACRMHCKKNQQPFAWPNI